MTTRFRDGNVTVTLDDGLERWVRGLLSAAERETLASLEAAAEEVAAKARAAWYGADGVTRETGLTGDIAVVSTIDNVRGEIRVSVGSTDTRTAGKSGKPVPVFVHRPGRSGLVRKQVTHDEYWATSTVLRANYHPLPADSAKHFPGDPAGSGPFIWTRNPKASDGKFLLTELVRKPGRAKVKLLAGELARRIVARAQGSA